MEFKSDFIAKHGKEAYEKRLERTRAWSARNKVRKSENSREQNRKGGKYYEQQLRYNTTGIPGARQRIRMRDHRKWWAFKCIIAPGSQLHHSWLPGTAEYTGLALVEAEQHMHGFIDVIKILEGEITLFTEKEIREQRAEQWAEL